MALLVSTSNPKGELYLNAKDKIIPKYGEVEIAEQCLIFRKCRGKGGVGDEKAVKRNRDGAMTEVSQPT